MLKVILKNKEMQKLMTIFDLELYKVFNAFQENFNQFLNDLQLTNPIYTLKTEQDGSVQNCDLEKIKNRFKNQNFCDSLNSYIVVCKYNSQQRGNSEYTKLYNEMMEEFSRRITEELYILYPETFRHQSLFRSIKSLVKTHVENILNKYRIFEIDEDLIKQLIGEENIKPSFIVFMKKGIKRPQMLFWLINVKPIDLNDYLIINNEQMELLKMVNLIPSNNNISQFSQILKEFQIEQFDLYNILQRISGGQNLYKLQQLNLRNFTVFKELNLNFQPYLERGRNVFIIQGKVGKDNENEKINGAGKTSIIQQILTLFDFLKQNKRFISTLVENNEEVEATITGEFKNQNNSIVIQRKISQTGSKYTIFENNKQIQFQRNEYVNTYIENFLGEQYTWKILHIFSGFFETLQDLRGTQQLKQIEKIFKIEDFDQIFMNAQEEIKKIVQQNGKNQIQFSQLQQKIEALNKNKLFLTQELQSLVQKNNEEEIQKLEQKVQDQKQQIKKLQIHLGSDEDIDNVKQKIKENIKKLKQQIGNLQKEEKEYFQTINVQKQKIEELQKLMSNKQCPMCQREFHDADIQMYKSIIDTQNGIIQKQNEKIEEISKKMSQIEKEIQSYEEVYEKISSLESETKILNEKIKSLKQKTQEEIKKREKIQQEIDKINQELDQLMKEQQKIQEELKQNQIRESQLTKLSNLIKPKQAVRQKYLFEYLQVLNVIQKKYQKQLLFKNEEFQIINEDESIEFGIKRNNTFYPYNVLSNGEKKKISLLFIFQINEFMKIMNKQSKIELFVFDDFFAGLDDWQTIQILELILEFQREFDCQFIITNNNIQTFLSNTVIFEIIKDIDSGIQTLRQEYEI